MLNRRKFIGRAVLCAAAELWIGGAFADGRIVAVDQASTSAVIIAGNKVTWRWTPQDDSNVRIADRGLYAAIDECKVCDNGATLLVNASCGGVAAIDIAKTNVIWYARASRGNAGPHSVCRLPDGRVAVANSTGCDALEIIDARKAPLDPARQTLVRAAEVPGAHGVDWNVCRHSLFVLGYTNLYEFAYLPEKTALVELRRWQYDKVLGDAYGHDLVPDAKGGYFITNHSGVWRIDLETGTFSSVLARKNAKSFSRDSTKGDLVQLPTERWWSDRLIVVGPDGKDRVVGPFPGAKFYKARWFSSDALCPQEATVFAGNAVVDPRAGEPEGERIELWPKGRIPDVQANQYNHPLTVAKHLTAFQDAQREVRLVRAGTPSATWHDRVWEWLVQMEIVRGGAD